MKFLVPNYSCLQNPWLRGYRPQILALSVLCPQLNLLNPHPRKKFLGTPLICITSWSAWLSLVVEANSDPYLGSLGAAVHCGKDVVRVHGTEHKGWAVPGSPAVHTAKRVAWTPAFQTRHAHRRQELRPSFQLHLHTDSTSPLKLTCNVNCISLKLNVSSVLQINL